MDIAYGVTGVGIGHAIRSKTVIRHLLSKGHKIKVFSYGMAYEILKKSFDDVHKINGLEMFYENNKLRPAKTFFVNLFKLPCKIAKNFFIMKKFRPDVVITDFEPMTYFFGKFKKIKVISIDNINIISLMNTPGLKNKKARFLARIAAKLINPRSDEYIITAFPSEKNGVFPPVLREEILCAKPSLKQHCVVYLTSKDTEKTIIKALSRINKKFLVYGLGKRFFSGNIIFKDFNEREFIKNLASASAVICYGGFSLISEALYLGKPTMVIPIKDHYEQLLNADYVDKNKFGNAYALLTERNAKEFFKHTKEYRKNLAGYPHEGNEKLFRHLDKKLSETAL
jgi:uncharacterized protein (TIGR00661 family)